MVQEDAAPPDDRGAGSPMSAPWNPFSRPGRGDPPMFHVEPSVAAPADDAMVGVEDGEAAALLDGRGEAAEAVSGAESTSAPARDAVRRFPTARLLAVANQKGGVGKTTTAVSLAAALAERGAEVLLVDMDPQANASSGLGLRPADDQATIYHALVTDAAITDVIVPTPYPGLSFVPSSIDLAGAEVELVSAFSREQRLKKALATIQDRFDVVLIDCPPSLGLLTVNALTAADGVIVPIQCEYYALEGLTALRHNVELVRANLNTGLDITGFVLTMLDGRTRLSRQVAEQVRAHFGERVFRSRIPRSVRLAEAPSFAQPITVFDPSSRGAMAYRRLASELLTRLERQLASERSSGA